MQICDYVENPKETIDKLLGSNETLAGLLDTKSICRSQLNYDTPIAISLKF